VTQLAKDGTRSWTTIQTFLNYANIGKLMNIAVQGLYFSPIGVNVSLHCSTKGLYASCLV